MSLLYVKKTRCLPPGSVSIITRNTHQHDFGVTVSMRLTIVFSGGGGRCEGIAPCGCKRRPDEITLNNTLREV